MLETRKPPTPEVVRKIAAGVQGRAGARSRCSSPRRPAWPAACRSSPGRSRRPCTSWPSSSSTSSRIVSAHGTAPLPPVAADDLAAIGRTNDAILYGARVILCVTGDDASLESIGPQVPSSASRDHGDPFATIFARYNHDFYAVDPHLFSPAEVVFQNIETGRSHAFGQLEPGVAGPPVVRRSDLMKTLAALVSGFGWHVADLQRAAARLDVVLARRAVRRGLGLGRRRRASGAASRAGGLDLMDVDGVLVRMMPPGSLEQVVFRMDALHRLAAAGVPVLNPPRAIEAAVDKYLTLALLARLGAARPRDLGRPVGDGGAVGLRRARAATSSSSRSSARRDGAWSASAIASWPGGPFMPWSGSGPCSTSSRSIRHPGHDLRVFVLNGTVLGAMRRHAPPGDWRTNVSLGGRAEPCRLSAEEERLAIAAAAAVGAEWRAST